MQKFISELTAKQNASIGTHSLKSKHRKKQKYIKTCTDINLTSLKSINIIHDKGAKNIMEKGVSTINGAGKT